MKKKAEESDVCKEKGCIESMADEMLEQMLDCREQVPMYVLTNDVKYYGAACILYDGVLKEFAESAGRDLYILPSSVHEVILLPDMGYEDVDMLKKMVCEVNDTQLSPDEVLSDTIYHYDRDTEDISMVSFAER